MPDVAVSAANVWRSLERETGIEPATNSLEGCDSTTELLPPSRLADFADSPLRRASPPRHFPPADSPLQRASPPRCFPDFADSPLRRAACLPPLDQPRTKVGLANRNPPSLSPSRPAWPKPRGAITSARRRLVAREGFEPSKPLGRQIYSLLRLTASLPRRNPPADAPGLTCSRC